MVIFALILIMTIVASLIENRQLNRYFSVIVVLLMIFVVGLRGMSVGTDTPNYAQMYLFGGSARIEPLFTMLIRVCSFLGFSVNMFFLVVSLINFSIIWWFLKKESINIGFSLLAFYTFNNLFYFEMFNTIRACLAIAIVILCTYFLDNKKYKFAILCALLSFFTHYSSIIPLFLICLINFTPRFSFKTVFLLIVGSFLLSFSIGDYIKELADVVTSMSVFVGDNDAIENYMDYFSDLDESNWSIVGLLTTMLPFSIFSLLTYNEQNSSSLYYKAFVIGAVLTNLFVKAMFTYRITAFLLIYSIVLIPNSYYMNSGYKKWSLLGMNCFMVIWFLYKLLTASEGSFCEAVPYNTCF